MIATSLLFLFGLGMTAAVVLAVASKVLYVKEDPRISRVESMLPGANCGGCGYPGCAAAAAAIVAGKEGPDLCVAGGGEVAENVAGVLGLEVLLKDPEFAFHDRFCMQRSRPRYIYEGVQDCRAQAMLFGGERDCGRCCLGLGTCVRACPFDALSLSEQGVPVIDPAKCRACGKCAEVCPHGVLTIASVSARILHMNTTGQCLAPCRQVCPAQINIPQYIEQIKNREYEQAILTLKERNPLILCIGRVCPAPCESYCRRVLVDDPVGINYLKRFVADWEMNSGRRVDLPCAPETGRRVAVVGGGPAGLSCAFFLRRLGHSPVIFESKPKLGGQLRYGIPEYRLPKKVLDWEIEGILGLGIETRTEVEFGRDFDMESLRAEGFEAVFLGMGAWLNYTLRLPDEDAPGVLGGTEYLTAVGLGRAPEVGDSVVVVGGGNTAIDCARTARRQGARVTLMYRRTKKEMPANQIEIHAAEEEGVEFLLLAAPTRVVLGEDGRVSGVECQRMELGEPDASGRRAPVPVEGSEEIVPAATLLSAIGQFPDTCWAGEVDSGCEISRRKTIMVDEDTMQTNVPGVFAGGDLVAGPALVVTAIGQGRKAARGIHYHLMQGEIPVPEDLQKEVLPEALFDTLEGVEAKPRVRQPELCVEDRVCNFREVEQTITGEDASAEAERCLRCGSTCYNRDMGSIASCPGPGATLETSRKGCV